jgi:SpoVK/Ycf46/Vps4 family AAA+-type ATPase
VEGKIMKKKNIINLIKYFAEHNDSAFKEEAYTIARIFDDNGDYQLSQYIMSLLSNTNTFVPQVDEYDSVYFRKVKLNNDPLPLPQSIKEDIVGIINAVSHDAGVNKFLFEGAPGTGKTETVKQIARILERNLYVVEFESVLDSKMGQTSKNIVELFNEIRSIPNIANVVVLFDELDSIVMDRINQNDLREMGRVTSTFLRELDRLEDDVLLFATTNIFESFDKALLRRFDAVINFNRYSKSDLIEVAESILNSLLAKFKNAGRNMRLFRKIINLFDEIPYPGDLVNLIKTSLAFSSPSDEFDYLKKIMNTVHPNYDLKYLSDSGFTLREIEMLTNVSKSQASRELRG